jgi:hypothetical protein
MMISAGIISLLLKMELTIGDAFGAALATFRLSSHRSFFASPTYSTYLRCLCYEPIVALFLIDQTFSIV